MYNSGAYYDDDESVHYYYIKVYHHHQHAKRSCCVKQLSRFSRGYLASVPADLGGQDLKLDLPFGFEIRIVFGLI